MLNKVGLKIGIMSNDEYQQRQYWEPTEEELILQLGRSIYKVYEILYDTSKYKTMLGFLTENTETKEDYKWIVNK